MPVYPDADERDVRRPIAREPPLVAGALRLQVGRIAAEEADPVARQIHLRKEMLLHERSEAPGVRRPDLQLVEIERGRATERDASRRVHPDDLAVHGNRRLADREQEHRSFPLRQRFRQPLRHGPRERGTRRKHLDLHRSPKVASRPQPCRCCWA